MGFLGLMKPKWRHRDAAVRLTAVGELTYDRQDVFATLAANDPDARVRVAAAHRVNEQVRLEPLLQSADAEVVRIVRERLSGVAVKLARERPLSACAAVLSTISDQKSLAELSLEAADAGVRNAAFTRLLAQSEPSQAMLALVAVQDASGSMATQAVARLDKRALLKDVARKAKVEAVRQAAQTRLTALEEEATKPSAEQGRKARCKQLEPLASEAARLALSRDWERAAAAWQELEAKRQAVLSAFVAIPLDDAARGLDERIQRGQRDFTQRRQDHRERTTAAVEARTQFLAELAALSPDAAEAETRRVQFQARWAAMPAGPEPLTDADRRFAAELLRLCQVTVVADAGEPAAPSVVLSEAEARELDAVSAESESLVASSDIQAARDRYQLLHKRWMTLVVGLPLHDAQRQRFVSAYAQFKDRQRAERAERDDRRRERLAELEKLALEAEALAATPPAAEDLRAHGERLRDVQARWKAVGPLRPDLINKVRGRFRAACDAAYAPVRALHEAEDWQRFAQQSNADELIAQAEALVGVTELPQLSKRIKQIQADWKQLGPLPRDKRESSWQRFKVACDVQYERLKPYFAELDAQRQANLVRKQVLLAEAQALVGQGTIGLAGSPADLAARRAKVERMKAIQVEWKEIGPVPREHDQELWQAYRAVGDVFYGQHRAEMSARHDEHVQNLALKESLCVAVEDLAKDAENAVAGTAARIKDPGDRLLAIKNLQGKWKEIGHVPREQVEAVWTRFRTACDRVYATLKDHLAELDRQRQENLTKKQALITEAEEILKHENPGWFKDDLKQLQRQWREIGHVPREHLDEISRRFQDVSQRIFAL